MNVRTYTRWGTLLLAPLLLAGCSLLSGEPAPGVESDVDIYYTLFTDDYRPANHWVLDQEGQTVDRDDRFLTLYDEITGEPQCKMRHRLEGTDERDDYGNRRWKDLSALYDLEGNLLYDWDECYYESGFGDFVIRQNRQMMFYEETLPEDFESALWNFRTGEAHLDGVGHVYLLEKGRTAVLTDPVYRPLGVVDAAGEVLSGFPAPAEYVNVAETWNGYIIATNLQFLGESTGGERSYLLTPQWEERVSRDHLRSDRSDKYLYSYEKNAANPDAESSLVNVDGETVLSLPANHSVDYFDDELAILRSGEHDSPVNPLRKQLVRIEDGEVLVDDCEELTFAGFYDEDTVPERFIATAGDTLALVDRSGAVTAEREIEGLRYMEYMAGDLYRCSLRDGDDYTDTILDSALNTVIAADLYYSIYQSVDWYPHKTEHYPILQAQRRNPNNWQSRTDILDLQGNVLVEGLDIVYQVGPDRLAVRRGFEVGLMDWQGEWIVKRSIFTDLVDD